MKREFFNAETIFVFARRNYKVYASLGFIRKATTHYAVILGTRAESSFIRKDVIPQVQWSRTKHPKYVVRIKDTVNPGVNITKTIDLSVEVGSQVATVKLFVVDKLGADVIVGWDFCNRHVEAIRPRQGAVYLNDGIFFPIIRDAITWTKTKVPILEPQIETRQT